MNRLLLVLLLAFPLAVSAQIYKTVDEDGNTVFSDSPPTGGSSEKVQLGTTNSAPPPPPVSRPEKAAAEGEEKSEISVNIVSPVQDTTIAIGYAGNFSVEAQLNPPLAKGIYAQLLMDGTPIGNPQPNNAWSLSNVFRGSHVLTVVLTNSGGDHLAESPPITVHVLRAGL